MEWANEITWELMGVEGCNSNGEVYFNQQVYSTECCIPTGSYTLSCQDSYGDGWNSGYMVINGNTYCEDYFGYQETVLVSFGIDQATTAPTSSPTTTTSAPTEAPDTECTMRSVFLYTFAYGNEVTWDLAGVSGCDSGNLYFGDNGFYEFECCIPDGSFTLNCQDSYHDGWHNGYLEIEGHKFCDDFQNGHTMTETVTFPLEPITGCVDQAPNHAL